MTTIDREKLNIPAEVAIPLTLTSEVQSQQAVITPQELYKQGMEDIWERIHQLPRGQDQVVASQLWELGKASPTLTPIKFPALAAHSFITKQLENDHVVWKPCSTYLKDFWRIGIDVSQAYGFRLRPYQAFESSLLSSIQIYA
jgi:hypothetical protein